MPAKGYDLQIMKGDFNYTLKKLIELSLAVGKAPVIVFKPLIENMPIENKEVPSFEIPLQNKVAEPIKNYKSR